MLRSLLTDNPPSPWPGRLATPPGSVSPTLFEQQCGYDMRYAHKHQISESAVSWDLWLFVLI